MMVRFDIKAMVRLLILAILVVCWGCERSRIVIPLDNDAPAEKLEAKPVEPTQVDPGVAAPVIEEPAENLDDQIAEIEEIEEPEEIDETPPLQLFERPEERVPRWYDVPRYYGDEEISLYPSHPAAGESKTLSAEESMKYFQALHEATKERPQWNEVFDYGLSSCTEKIRARTLPPVDGVGEDLVVAGFHALSACCNADLGYAVVSAPENDPSLHILNYGILDEEEVGCDYDTGYAQFLFRLDGDDVEPIASLMDWIDEEPNVAHPDRPSLHPWQARLKNVIALDDGQVGFVLGSDAFSQSSQGYSRYHEGLFLTRLEPHDEGAAFRLLEWTAAIKYYSRPTTNPTRLRIHDGRIFFEDFGRPSSEFVSWNDDLIAIGDQQISPDWDGYQSAYEAFYHSSDGRSGRSEDEFFITLQSGDDMRAIQVGQR